MYNTTAWSFYNDFSKFRISSRSFSSHTRRPSCGISNVRLVLVFAVEHFVVALVEQTGRDFLLCFFCAPSFFSSEEPPENKSASITRSIKAPPPITHGKGFDASVVGALAVEKKWHSSCRPPFERRLQRFREPLVATVPNTMTLRGS